MKPAAGVFLLAALLPAAGWFAYDKALGTRLGAPPSELATEYRTEEQWLVTETVRDIAEMAAFAASGQVPRELRVEVVAAQDAGGWTAAVRRPGGEIRRPVALTVGVWSPSDYLPLAQDLVANVRPAAPSGDGDDAGVLTRLSDIRAAVVEREAQRISATLATGMADPGAHEQAALVLAAFAMREAAGAFADHRPALCRMTAHLAMARALRRQAPPGLAGRYAEAALLTLSRRTADALATLEAMSAAPAGGGGAAAWHRALRLRATSDWRDFGSGEGRTLLERIEYFAAMKRTKNLTRAAAFLNKAGRDAVPDWGRVMTADLSFTVEEGNRFVETALALEEAEIAEVRAASGAGALAADRRVAALNEKPGRCLSNARPQVLGQGAWAAFWQRHIAHHVRSIDHHVRTKLALPGEADVWQRRLDRDWGGLTLFPVAACWRTRGAEQNLDRLQEAVDVAIEAPERVPAYSWLHLEASVPFEALRRGMPGSAAWFASGFPRGTAYDTRGRLGYTDAKLKTVPDDDASLAKLAALDPFDYYIPQRRATLLPRNRPRTADELFALFGARAAYDHWTLDWIDHAVSRDPVQSRQVQARQCDLDVAACPGFAWHLWRLGERATAVATFERAAADAHADPVGLSHHAGWVARYYLNAGQKDRAMRVAEVAARTGSAPGLQAMGEVLERLGRFDEAEAHFQAEADRYDQPGPLIAFHFRMVHAHGDAAHASKLQQSAKKLFPRGLEATEAAGLTSPPEDGVFVNGWTQEMLKQDLRAGDVIVGLDGWRVRTAKQYLAVRDFREGDEMALTVWRGSYRNLTVKFPDRRMSVDIVDYPQKGWVGQ